MNILEMNKLKNFFCHIITNNINHLFLFIWLIALYKSFKQIQEIYHKRRDIIIAFFY